jgi:DNA-3-methyladenine glycosylase I
MPEPPKKKRSSTRVASPKVPQELADWAGASAPSKKRSAHSKRSKGDPAVTARKKARRGDAAPVVSVADSTVLVSAGREDPPSVSEGGPWYNVFTKGDAEYNRYMAREWGIEKRGDVALFEKLSLEGAQSGLSWLTILRKRDAYRRVFHGFDIDRVAAMSERDVEAILSESSSDSRQIVVRHRGKIEAVINNAQRIQRMLRDHRESNERRDGKADRGVNKHGVFDQFLWSFVGDAPMLNEWDGNLGSAATKSEESVAMSKALKSLGFKFVGPTTCYAMMQSVGMVIDHPSGSPEWREALDRLQKRPGGFQDRRRAKS